MSAALCENGTCQREGAGVDTGCEMWLCPECRRSLDANDAADAWLKEHAAGFFSAVLNCDDVQTLRALAHRLGYKEGT